MCCRGCQTVASLISQSGLTDFYRFREVQSNRNEELQDTEKDWQWLDRPAIAQHYAQRHSNGQHQITLILDNLHCAACAWLIQHFLHQQAGVTEAAVDLQAARLHLLFDPENVRLSALARQLAQLGYPAHLDSQDERQARQKRERRALLLRLSVAGLGMMQVMSYAVAVYIGAVQDLDEQTRQFFHSVSMLVALPITVFAGWPFYMGAWRSLRLRQLGMDVPVASAMLLALLISVINTLRGSGDVYFDSVSMFVFFLLLGRYAVTTARHHAEDSQAALAASLPEHIIRLDPQGEEQRLARIELVVGDRVRVPAGEAIPGDGVIEHGQAMLDEALLSGESTPKRRGPGDNVLAGSINRDGGLVLRIKALGADTLLGQIQRNLEGAGACRPEHTNMADRLARHFVCFVLLGAALTAIYWGLHAPQQAVGIVIAVLVVSCPCALALGTPTALAAGSRRLAGMGVLVPDPDRLEQATELSDVVLDKTGTLTSDRMRISGIYPTAEIGERDLLTLAASVERHSQHPIARAIVSAADGRFNTLDEVAEVHAGLGVSVQRGNTALRVGKASFVAELLGPQHRLQPPGHAQVAIADSQRGLLGWIALDSPLREGADHLLACLQQRGLKLHLASGDQQANVDALAGGRPFVQAQGDMSPNDKLALIERLRQQGAKVAVIGDGINDAPMLAAADLAIALADGAALARTRADLILTGQSLSPLARAIGCLDSIRLRVRQNLTWAMSYNVIALPLAAAGWVPAWAAAIGMSASSLLVVLNAQRGGTRERQQQAVRLSEVQR